MITVTQLNNNLGRRVAMAELTHIFKTNKTSRDETVTQYSSLYVASVISTPQTPL